MCFVVTCNVLGGSPKENTAGGSQADGVSTHTWCAVRKNI